jgi:hypothetical protein
MTTPEYQSPNAVPMHRKVNKNIKEGRKNKNPDTQRPGMPKTKREKEKEKKKEHEKN